jgi:hypothetical protein
VTLSLSETKKKKANGVINFNHVSAFNDWVNKWGLIEINDPTRSFSWSNHQDKPIMAKLDRVFASIEWNIKYPPISVVMLSKGVSNHDPLKISFGDKN